MPTVKEKMKELMTKQHELGVWEMLYAHLDDNFIKKDARDVKLLKVTDCLEEIVPEDTIDKVLRDMAEGPIKRLQDEVRAIQNEEVTQGGANGKARAEPSA